MPKFATDGENLFAQISFQVKYYKDTRKRRRRRAHQLVAMLVFAHQLVAMLARMRNRD
jgi:hypothetical protein